MVEIKDFKEGRKEAFLLLRGDLRTQVKLLRI